MPYCAYCGTPVDAVSYTPCPACGNPRNGAPRTGGTARQGGSNTAMIVVIVVVIAFVVVAFIGILSAIAIPNLLTAMQRSKQKRTMADMRTLATAVEAYETDTRTYPSAQELDGALVPKYIRVLPKLDGWGKPLRYDCWNKSGQGPCDTYTIASAGKDGSFEQDSLRAYPREPVATTKFDSDIVYSDGEFLEYPEGVQH